MTEDHPRFRALTAALALLALGGCATEQPAAAPPAPYTLQQAGPMAPSPAQQAAPQGPAEGPGPSSQAQGQQRPATPFPFLQNVDLTQQQITRIQSIVKRYAPSSAGSQNDNQFKQIMGAPTLDTAQLRTFLTNQDTQQREAQAELVRMFAAVRDVLTPAQRQQASQSIRQTIQQASQQQSQQQPAGPGGEATGQQPSQGAPQQGASQAPPGPKLNLSDAQKALFKAASPTPPDPSSMLSALATLMDSGDTQALTEALTPSESLSDRVDAQMAAWESLSYQQRQTLITYKPPTQGQSGQAGNTEAPPA